MPKIVSETIIHKKIDRHLEYIDKRIKDFEAALDETDKEEEKELLESKIKLQQDRRKKYETLDTELKNSNDTQVSLTDKDSRALMLTNNVSGVGYAVQAASDSKHKLLVHSHIGASTDKRELSTAALTVQELLQLDSFNTLSDAGYTMATNYKPVNIREYVLIHHLCHQHRLIPIPYH